MPSPTFNLAFRYDVGDRTIWHLDLYRLDDEEDVWELGWADLGRAPEIVLIEWPERAAALLPADRWDILLEPGPDPLTRLVRTQPHGDVPPLPEPA